MKYKPEYLKSNELHITSVLVQVAHEHLSTVRQSIEDMQGAEVHIVGEGGKLIASFEANDLGYITNSIDEIGRMNGVASATLIYHQTESEDQMDELIEVDPDNLSQLQNGNLS
jgi:nitrate reductase NapD